MASRLPLYRRMGSTVSLTPTNLMDAVGVEPTFREMSMDTACGRTRRAQNLGWLKRFELFFTGSQPVA